MNAFARTAGFAPADDRPAPRAAKLLLSLAERLERARLVATLPDGSVREFGRGGHAADIHFTNWDAFDAILRRGDIGFAEAYLDGHWETSDLAGLLTVLASNRAALARAIYGRGWSLLAERARHLLRANSRAGSRRNIAAHYDLGNDFYRLWLDPTMSYSSALFGGSTAIGLEEAQIAKYRRILDRLDARPGQTILEIGCGWGGFAEIAARERGCAVVGLTLSQEQLAYARDRMARAGLAERVRLELCDYRDVSGRYDHIVSIEMFEAVGERYWPTYFRRVAELLSPGGRALIQTITIDERLFARYRRGTDFIQRYVFPGGMLPSPGRFVAQAAKAGLATTGDHAFGRDYAITLRRWHERFAERIAEVERQGFDRYFQRLWRFYLAYCEAGFAAGSIDVHQFELTRA